MIIAVLRRHTASPNACEHAAGALGNLATHPDSKNAIASQGGVAAVIGALRAHVSGSASVTQMCLGCLKNLANGSEVTRETMEREGAIAVIFEALSIHSGSVPLVDLGCGALRNLSQTRECHCFSPLSSPVVGSFLSPPPIPGSGIEGFDQKIACIEQGGRKVQEENILKKREKRNICLSHPCLHRRARLERRELRELWRQEQVPLRRRGWLRLLRPVPPPELWFE